MGCFKISPSDSDMQQFGNWQKSLKETTEEAGRNPGKSGGDLDQDGSHHSGQKWSYLSILSDLLSDLSLTTPMLLSSLFLTHQLIYASKSLHLLGHLTGILSPDLRRSGSPSVPGIHPSVQKPPLQRHFP